MGKRVDTECGGQGCEGEGEGNFSLFAFLNIILMPKS